MARKLKRMDDDGEKKIHIGDTLTLITQTYDLDATKHELDDILGKQTVLQDEIGEEMPIDNKE